MQENILTEALQFLSNWWGLLFVLVVIVVMAVFRRQTLKRIAIRLIFVAEERSRQYALRTGKEKFEWVVENGYGLIPPWLKLFVTKEMFSVIVQTVFDNIVAWAEKQEVRIPQLE